MTVIGYLGAPAIVPCNVNSRVSRQSCLESDSTTFDLINFKMSRRLGEFEKKVYLGQTRFSEEQLWFVKLKCKEKNNN